MIELAIGCVAIQCVTVYNGHSIKYWLTLHTQTVTVIL